MKKTKMLKKNYEFKNVLSKGKYYSGDCIVAFIKNQKRDKNINFLGIAIGVKIGKAVERNRIKRLIRENYKILEESIKSGQEIVFLWKKMATIEKATFRNIKKDMNKILSKAGIYLENGFEEKQ